MDYVDGVAVHHGVQDQHVPQAPLDEEHENTPNSHQTDRCANILLFPEVVPALEGQYPHNQYDGELRVDLMHNFHQFLQTKD